MNNPRRGRGRSGRRPNIPTRSQNFDSNGPEGRVRGNAQQVYEKYLALARDAHAAGDRVLAEGFQQHAEHYFRVMNDSTDPDSRPREQQGQQSRDDRDDRDERDDGGDDDYRSDQPRGERRGQERRDERQADRGGDRGQERRAEHRRADEPRPNGHGGGHPGRQAGRGNEGQEPAGDAGQGGRDDSRAQDARGPEPRGPAPRDQEASAQDREGEGRETRLRERFNRRNGEGILTRRRGDEPREPAHGNGAGEEEADAGLRKMLGEDTRAVEGQASRSEPAGEPDAAKAAGDAGSGQAAAGEAPAKPRRRRRTKAEIEAEAKAKEQSAD